MAGPRKGAAEKAAMGMPRSSGFQRSARVPPTRTIGALNAIPSMKRHTSKVPAGNESANLFVGGGNVTVVLQEDEGHVPIFLATAQGIRKMIAIRSVTT